MSTDLYEIDGFQFGRDTPVQVVDVDRGDRSLLTQDVPRATGLGRYMGHDEDDGPEWTFTLRTRESDEASALDALAELRSVWHGTRNLNPGQVMSLRYELGGRGRRVVGRPRRFHESSSPSIREAGLINVVCTFQLSDPRSFGAGPGNTGEVTLTLVPESTGGLVAPLVSPLTTTRRGGVRAGVVHNTGDAPSPVSVTFYGPVANPKIYGVGWEVGITGNLAYDEQITVDALGMSVKRQDGADVGGRLTRGTRLNKAALAPGSQEIWFTGADATGTARAVVSWAAAYWSL